MNLRRPQWLPKSTPALALVVSVLINALVPSRAAAQAQEAVVAVEENIRAEPNGVILGQLQPGTRVRVEGREGAWTEVAIQGFVFIPSLELWTEGAMDLVVSAPDGENLREAPSGRIAGRLDAGTLLEEVGRTPGWIEVRRIAWIWNASLDNAATDAVAAPDPQGPLETSPPSPPETTVDWIRVGAAPVPILASPEGDTLGLADADSQLRVTGREGDWARVHLEGWVWVPGLSSEPRPGGVADEAAPISGVAAAELAMNPGAYEGRLLELELQFISIERAERLRTDFYEDEPFLLTRSTRGGRVFVYVAVPPERLPEMENIAPLEEIRVVGRVRSVSAAFTGNPILDLVEIERRP